MSASITEVHMGLGSFALDHDWDPAIAEVLAQRYCHLVIYWGESPFYAGVVTSTAPSKGDIRISGRGLDWWLGRDSDGALIRDREYLAGTNLLHNGDFSQGSDLWRLAQGTLWTVNGSAVFAGGSLLVDDTLEIDQNPPGVRPGNVYRSALTVTGGGGLGKLRLRTTYTGRFTHPNLLVNPSFELVGGSRGWSADTAALSIVSDAPNAHHGSFVLRAAAVPKPQLVAQPGFETGGAGWTVPSTISFVNDAANARSSSWAMRLAAIPKPQLLTSPGFETGSGWGTATYLSIITDSANARTGSRVLRAVEIPKPQLLANPSFDGSANWTSGPTFSFLSDASNAYEGSGVLRVSPNPQPQLLTNSGFESGSTGWNFPGTNEFSVPLTTIDNVFQGSQSLKAGPVNRDNVIPNPNFDSGSGESFSNWVHQPPPTVGTQAGDWYHDTGTFFNSPASATTTGGGDPNAHPHKWMRAHPSSGENDGFAVYPGERYRFEAKVRAAVDDQGRMDGEAHISVVFRPSQGGPTSEWQESDHIEAGGGEPGWEWNDLTLEFEVPDDMLVMQPHLVVDNHQWGYWHFDEVRLYKLRDNVSQAYSNSVTVEQDQTYEFSALVKSDVSMSQGTVELRAELTGPSVPTKNVTSPAQGSTKRKGFSVRDWLRIDGSFRVEEGYTTCRIFVVARDVLGGSFRVDNVELRKVSNNSAETLAASVGVTPKQRYAVEAYVRSGANLKGGTIHLRVIFSGAGKPDVEITTSPRGGTKNKWERIGTTATPPKGYTFASVAVVGTDVLGDYFWVDSVRLLKDTDNTDEITATAVTVVPEQPYRLSAFVRPSDTSAGTTTAGQIMLRTKLTGTGKPDVIVKSSPVGVNEDFEWTEVRLEVRPPAGYTTAVVSVVSIDIEGEPFWVDDILLEKAENNTARAFLSPAIAVVAGSRYQLVGHIRSAADVARGSVAIGVKLTGAGLTDVVVSRSQRITDNVWSELVVDITVPTGYTAATLEVTGIDIEGGNFWLDDLTLTRMSGNSDTMTGVPVAVTPERRYRWTMWARSDSSEVVEGNVRLGIRFTATGRSDVVVESSTVDGEGSDWKHIRFDFTPPSGYTTATPMITATDVAGGYFWVDDGDLRDTDTNTQVHDLVVSGPGSPFLTTTAPSGAEKVQVSLVAEANAPAYTVTSVSLSRADAGTDPFGLLVTVGQIVDELLRDPTSAAYASLEVGTVYGSDTLLHDWHLRNITARAALLDLCRSGVALPIREFRVNPDFTLDFGTAEQISESRPEVVLVEGEQIVIDDPEIEHDAEQLITDIVVIGADRESPSGVRSVVQGSASLGTVAHDRFGNPVRRFRVVSEAAITHNALADAYAAYLLEEANRVRESISVEIADWRAFGGSSPPSFRVGDWVGVYKPEAGLEDPDNERVLRGRVVYPVEKRVVSRTTQLGAGSFRAELIPPGTTGYGSYATGYRGSRVAAEPVQLPNVRWADNTSASLELGDLPAEFATDSGLGSFATQFMRFRASTSH